MTEVYWPQRGDIIWVVLDPQVGHEQSGRRPAVVLSDRSLTENTGMAVMCPITTKPRGLPYEVALEDTSTQGVVLPTQVKSVDVYARKVKFIERAPVQVVARVQQLVISMVEG